MAAGHAAERPFRMDAKPNKPVYVPPARLTAAGEWRVEADDLLHRPHVV